MKFSIITCTYNSDKWLKKNIESVCQQSYKDFEHIFVDAFSTDQTLKIITDYKDKFPKMVKLFQLEVKGISNAMNEGIKRSIGEYIIHLHSDDSLYDQHVLSDVNNFLVNKNFDWIYGKINVVEEDGQEIGTFPNKRIFQQGSDNLFSKHILKFYNYIPHQAVFIKKNVFERYGYFDEKLTSSMDRELWLRISQKTSWGFINRIISNYCLRSTSESASKKNKMKNRTNYLLVQKRYLNFLELIISRLIVFLVNGRNKNLR